MFININGVVVEIQGFSENDYNRIKLEMKTALSNPKAKNRDIIIKHFLLPFH